MSSYGNLSFNQRKAIYDKAVKSASPKPCKIPFDYQTGRCVQDCHRVDVGGGMFSDAVPTCIRNSGKKRKHKKSKSKSLRHH